MTDPIIRRPDDFKVDKPRIERAVREILLAIGEDPEREGLLETPQRVARMYEELFQGLGQDPASHLQKFFTERYASMVVVKDVEFHSMCEHHLVPFFGTVDIAYLPHEGRVAGFGTHEELMESNRIYREVY